MAYAAAMPSLSVTVSDASGKLAYKGKTNGAGTFATGNLSPGKYNVQFNGASMSGNYALVISAGKQKVASESVAGSKFAAGGVAMRLDVGKGLNITGQVTTAKPVSAADSARVKIVNGKKYVWVGPRTGSNMGGRWVDADSADAQDVINMGTEAMRNRQDHGDAHQEGFGGH